MFTALAKEVSSGHTAGPFPSPRIPNLQCSPLGVVPKKDGTWRLIVDLSSPHGSSVNDYISKEDFTLHCAAFDQAPSLVACHTKDSLMVKLNLKHAFQLCPVCPDNRELLGIHWQDNWLALLTLQSALTMFKPLLMWPLRWAYPWPPINL